MASERAGTLMEGSLYESIARGNKDVYFMNKSFQDTLNPFETRYERRPGFVNELRHTVPLNAPDFGRSCEFEFPMAGEICMDATVLIDLPTWLPPEMAAANTDWNNFIQTPAGIRYGYTRGIAYFLFSSIQIFQDKVLLYETTGDSMWASHLTAGSLNSAWLTQTLSGQRGFDADTTDISRLATPGRLRLRIPIPGNERGLPSCSMRRQNFRLKLVLRTLEECVESSDSSALYPAPWKEAAFQKLSRTGGSPVTFNPIPRELIGKPVLTLETRHVYLDPESRAEYEEAKHEIPYYVLYENQFTFSGTPEISAVKIIDAEHPASSMFWFLRTWDNLRRNRRWATSSSSTNPYYRSATFLIAGRDREASSAPILWNSLVPFTKEERDPGFALGEMNWDLGPGTGREAPHVAVPEGSINFSTAEKPAFRIFMRTPETGDAFDTKTLELTVVVRSWALYMIEDGRGFTAFSN